MEIGQIMDGLYKIYKELYRLESWFEIWCTLLLVLFLLTSLAICLGGLRYSRYGYFQ